MSLFHNISLKLNMKTLLNIKKKSLTTVALFLLFIGAIKAQKLPNIQNSGFRAPVNVKVDGKATEWGNQFQAYNKGAQVFYTIANDDTNLYLCIKAPDPLIVDKIITYGVTFDIYKPGNNTNKKNSVSITYPLIGIKDLGAIKSSLYNTAITRNADSVHLRQKADSITSVWNNRFAAKSKDITVTGIASIPDSSVSVYNDLGFKATLFFDTPKSAVYELAIPLKQLSLSMSVQQRFNIK
jgi:hypothetical protein